MAEIVKFLILLSLISLAGYGLWRAIRGSVAKRPDKKQAVTVYAIWLILMVAGMIAIHPAMMLLPMIVLVPMIDAAGLANYLGVFFFGWKPEPRPGERGIKLILEDMHDMGINALFTGVFLFIVYFVAYAFYPQYLG